MSYSVPRRRQYTFPSVNFATSSSQQISGPKGKAGRVIEVHVSATVTFTNTTTAGRVDIGNTTTANANMSVPLGTLAAGSALSSEDSATLSTITVTDRNVPADTAIKVSFVAPTGGSPAGTGTVLVVVHWDD